MYYDEILNKNYNLDDKYSKEKISTYEYYKKIKTFGKNKFAKDIIENQKTNYMI